jgi:D-alanine-D-alanine ligase
MVKKVLLLFGGESSEHDVSISSAHNVYAAIDDDRYDVSLCYIDRQGKWMLLESFDVEVNTHNAPQLMPVLGTGSFVTMPDHKIIKPDVIFPVLHGKNGEDGTVQGLAELLHIPIVGCGVQASSTGMDKLATKELAAFHDIKIVPYTVHRIGEEIPQFEKLSLSLGSPLFVKPSRAGSSVGVSKVHNDSELEKALDEAHGHDKVVLIEQAINARELETAVLGTPPRHMVSGVGEIVPGADFYSFDDKYASGSSASVKIPADIPTDLEAHIQSLAKKMFQVLNASGLSRVDFFLSDDGELYFNEINTLPGFTNISMYPKLWRQQGISYPQLIERLISDAVANK